MKQEGKKHVKLITVFVVLLIAVLLIVSLTFNRDALFGDKGTNLENDAKSGDTTEDINQGDTNQNNETTNNNQENTSGDEYMYLQGTKKVGSVEFSNIRIKKLTRNKCEFLADVENLTEEYLEPQSVTIKVIDDSGGVDEIFAGILTELAPYEPNRFKTQVLSDITDAVDVEIEVDGA